MKTFDQKGWAAAIFLCLFDFLNSGEPPFIKQVGLCTE